MEPLTAKIGDKVSFLRQCVGYKTKVLTGKIVNIGSTIPIAIENVNGKYKIKETREIAVKAECEYGSCLPYNHTLSEFELTKIN